MERQSRVRTTLRVAPVGAPALLLTGVAASSLAVGDAVGLVDPETGILSLRDGAGRTHASYCGIPADFPFSADQDCNGTDSPGLYRQSDGYDVASIEECHRRVNRQIQYLP